MIERENLVTIIILSPAAVLEASGLRYSTKGCGLVTQGAVAEVMYTGNGLVLQRDLTYHNPDPEGRGGRPQRPCRVAPPAPCRSPGSADRGGWW